MTRTQNAVSGVAAVVISVISGAWTLFHLIWNMQQQTADDYWGQALLILS
jgi:hypothetical protein